MGRSAPPPLPPAAKRGRPLSEKPASERPDAPALHRAPLRFLFPPSLGQLRASVRAELLSTTLSARLRRPVVVEVGDSYEELERQVVEGEVELAWAPPALCAKVAGSARAILRATRGGRSDYHSALICRADEPLTIVGLAGRRAAWVDRRSTGGYLLAAAHLRRLGEPPEKVLASEQFYGSYRAALRAVLSGEADFTAIYVTDVDHESVRATLAEIVGEDERRFAAFEITAGSPTDGLVITSRASKSDADTLIKAILPDGSTQGPSTLLQVCDADSFALAEPGDYAALQDGATPASSPSIGIPGREVRSGPEATLVSAPKPLLLRLDRARRCQEAFQPGGRRSPHDLRGARLDSIFGETLSGQVDAAIDAAIARKGPAHVGFSVQGPSGRTHLEVNVTLGAPGEVVLVVADVTERKRVDAELLAFASYPTLDPEPCIDVATTESGLVVSAANPAARRMFPDLWGAEAAGSSAHPLLVGLAPLVAEALELGEPRHGEVAVVGGSLHVTVSPVPEGRGCRVYAATGAGGARAHVGGQGPGLPSKVTFALSEEIEASARVVTESFTHVSEEVSATGETGEHLVTVLRALDRAQDAGKRLVRLAESLRALASDRAPRTVSVRAALEKALALHGALGRRAELVRDFGAAPDVTAVEGDLVQVFLALLVNAGNAVSTPAAPAGSRRNRPTVRLVVRTDAAGKAVVEVCDNGPGIAAERLPRVLEEPALGLDGATAAVRALGGEIVVDSHVGQGTTFSVVLPPSGAQLTRQS